MDGRGKDFWGRVMSLLPADGGDMEAVILPDKSARRKADAREARELKKANALLYAA
jgi:hypothetical protein